MIIDGAAKLAARRAAMTLTPAQLLRGLWRSGFISAAEAEAAATVGTLPAAVAAVVSGLPEDEQVEARIKWARMSVVMRADPLVDLLAAAAGQTPEQIDAFFQASSEA